MPHFIRALALHKGILSLKAFAFLYAINTPYGTPPGTIVKCYGTVRVNTGTQLVVEPQLLYKFEHAAPGWFTQLNLPAKNIWCMSSRPLPRPVLIYGAY